MSRGGDFFQLVSGLEKQALRFPRRLNTPCRWDRPIFHPVPWSAVDPLKDADDKFLVVDRVIVELWMRRTAGLYEVEFVRTSAGLSTQS